MTVAMVVAAAAAAPHRKVTVVMAMPMTVLVPGFVGKAVGKPSGKHIQ
jgi:hypothetical protein